MTAANFIQTSLELLAAAAIVLGFYHEDKLIKFERKAFLYVKCFFKACLIILNNKLFGEKKNNVVEISEHKIEKEQALDELDNLIIHRFGSDSKSA